VPKQHETEPVDPPELGKCGLMVNIIEGRDLVVGEQGGILDPFVKVR
jgi:hypothetical protein